MNSATTSSHVLNVKIGVVKAVHVPKSSSGASKPSDMRGSANHRDSEKQSLSSETSTQSSLSASSQSPFPPRKHSRSSSFTSPSPPPARQRSSSQTDHISSEIWKMFGKDRDAYMKRPVSSDDEDTDDMEADPQSLWAEERKRFCFFFFSIMFQQCLEHFPALASRSKRIVRPKWPKCVMLKKNAVGASSLIERLLNLSLHMLDCSIFYCKGNNLVRLDRKLQPKGEDLLGFVTFILQ
jgi:hypothetical protein